MLFYYVTLYSVVEFGYFVFVQKGQSDINVKTRVVSLMNLIYKDA